MPHTYCAGTCLQSPAVHPLAQGIHGQSLPPSTCRAWWGRAKIDINASHCRQWELMDHIKRNEKSSPNPFIFHRTLKCHLQRFATRRFPCQFGQSSYLLEGPASRSNSPGYAARDFALCTFSNCSSLGTTVGAFFMAAKFHPLPC